MDITGKGRLSSEVDFDDQPEEGTRFSLSDSIAGSALRAARAIKEMKLNASVETKGADLKETRITHNAQEVPPKVSPLVSDDSDTSDNEKESVAEEAGPRVALHNDDDNAWGLEDMDTDSDDDSEVSSDDEALEEELALMAELGLAGKLKKDPEVTCVPIEIKEESIEERLAGIDFDPAEEAFKVVEDRLRALMPRESVEEVMSRGERLVGILTREHVENYYPDKCCQVYPASCALTKRSDETYEMARIRHSFKKEAKGKTVEVKKLGEGMTGALMVTFDGEPQYVMKKVDLADDLNKRDVIKFGVAIAITKGLKAYEEKSLNKEKEYRGEAISVKAQKRALKRTYAERKAELDAFLKQETIAYFNKQISPFYTAAHREVQAYEIGKEYKMDIPEVHLRKYPGSRVYSCHKYLKNVGSLAVVSKEFRKKVDPASVERAAHFNRTIDQYDGHAGNILVVKTARGYELRPFDYALSNQSTDLLRVSAEKEGGGYSLSAVESDLSAQGAPLRGARDFLIGQNSPFFRLFDYLADEPVSEGTKTIFRNADMKAALGRIYQGRKLTEGKAERINNRRLLEVHRRGQRAAEIPGITNLHFDRALEGEQSLKALELNPEISGFQIMLVEQMDEEKFRKYIRESTPSPDTVTTQIVSDKEVL